MKVHFYRATENVLAIDTNVKHNWDFEHILLSVVVDGGSSFSCNCSTVQ